MKPPPFSYHLPGDVAEAVAMLSKLENAKLLAGGQSLMPMLNMRYVLPDHVIDLNRIDTLSYIREDGDALEIGAMTRQRDLEFSDLVKARCPLMHEALLQVGPPNGHRACCSRPPPLRRRVPRGASWQIRPEL